MHAESTKKWVRTRASVQKIAHGSSFTVKATICIPDIDKGTIFELITHPDNSEIFPSAGQCTHRKLLSQDEGQYAASFAVTNERGNSPFALCTLVFTVILYFKT